MSADGKSSSETNQQANQEPSVTASAASSAASSAGAPNAAPVSPSAAAGSTSGTPLKMPRTLGAVAHERIAHLADAIAESELQRVNTDLTSMSVTALGAWPKIKSTRGDILRKAPTHDMTLFDAFEDICLSLGHVEAQVNATEEENRVLTGQWDAIKAEVSNVKAFLVGLAKYGDINVVPLRKVGTEFGYRATLDDAATVIEMLVQNWSKFGDKPPFSAERLQEFDREVAAFRVAVGLKEQNPEGPRLELMRRRRVYTLFRLAVTNIREALIYVYGESRVGEYVPAFSNATGKARSGSKDEPGTPAEQPTDSAEANLSAARRPSGFVVNNPENLPITPPFIEEEDGDKQRSA